MELVTMKAVRESEGGILVDIEVSTKSNKFEISGYNTWREAIEIRIKSVPQKGKANKEITKEFSKLTRNPVEIVTGHKSHHKTLKIHNMGKDEFLKIMGSYF